MNLDYVETVKIKGLATNEHAHMVAREGSLKMRLKVLFLLGNYCLPGFVVWYQLPSTSIARLTFLFALFRLKQ